MAATQLNDAVTVIAGGQAEFGNSYIVESSENPDFNVKSSDIEDASGVLVQRLVFQRAPRIRATLLCLQGAVPETDFPKGKMCALSGYTTYYVNDAVPSKTKDITRISVDLEAIFTNS